ncbi:MAG TPA: hypothetical protein VGI72_06345 [Gaiellales bacterium]
MLAVAERAVERSRHLEAVIDVDQAAHLTADQFNSRRTAPQDQVVDVFPAMPAEDRDGTTEDRRDQRGRCRGRDGEAAADVIAAKISLPPWPNQVSTATPARSAIPKGIRAGAIAGRWAIRALPPAATEMAIVRTKSTIDAPFGMNTHPVPNALDAASAEAIPIPIPVD